MHYKYARTKKIDSYETMISLDELCNEEDARLQNLVLIDGYIENHKAKGKASKKTLGEYEIARKRQVKGLEAIYMNETWIDSRRSQKTIKERKSELDMDDDEPTAGNVTSFSVTSSSKPTAN